MKRQSVFFVLFVSLLLALPMLVMAEEIKTLAIGAAAPEFRLPGVDGKTYTLEDFEAAQVLVLIFTCNHCPTAQAYESRIQSLHNEYKDKGVAVVAISPNDPLAVRLDELGYSDMNDSFEEMKIRAKMYKFAFPYLYDGEKQEASKAYGPVATPHVFVFDQARTLRYCGRIDNNEKPAKVTNHDTRDAIEALLEGKPVAVETTKTFGCSVKWADKRDGVAQADEAWAKEPVTLELASLDEIKTLVSNQTNKTILINVWATWCGPCVEEFPELVIINRMYRKRDFQMISICVDDVSERGKALEFLKKNQAAFTNVMYKEDDKYALMDALDPEAPGSIPYTLLIKPGGEVIYRKAGVIDPQELKTVIVNQIGRYYP